MAHNMPSDQPWTDFYFKGIRDGSVIFSYNTATPSGTGAHLSVWYIDSQNASNPAWVEQAASGSIFSQLTSMDSFVGGWVFVVRGLAISRAELSGVQWSIAYMDADTAEQDPGDGWIWRPLRPIELVEPGWQPQ